MIINNNAPLLIESAWEVCNQVGGIYTVIRSKVPTVVNKWADRYALLGPYVKQHAAAEFEAIDDYDEHPVGRAVKKMREAGFEAYYGSWLISGRPRIALFNVQSVQGLLRNIKNELLSKHGIPVPDDSDLHNRVISFGYLCAVFLKYLEAEVGEKQPIVAQFHEWMAASHMADIKEWNSPTIKMVFTTHATQLGRYIAGNDDNFYDRLKYYNWRQEARRYGIESAASIERTAALSSDIFTTVSEITGKECEAFLGRKPDIITPNGLNIQRFEALHEFQNLHKEYKDRITQFIIGHFFHNYKFDLNNTVYLVTSGRYEYKNKGFDIFLESLNRLNQMMKRYNINKTVIAFIVTKRPVHTINPLVLEAKAMLDGIKRTTEAITEQLGQKLFVEVTAGTSPKLPSMNDMIDEYWKLRLRRKVQAWKSDTLPIVVTHNLIDDANDEILNYIREHGLYNKPEDKVKIVYHPDFITPSSPLFSMDYSQFIRGCHLGVFPSYYEPWGYTPLECLASGIPSITSDLSGFGDYVMKNVSNYQQKGIYVVRRYNRSFNDAAQELTDQIYGFVQKELRDRIDQRNQAEAASVEFDWSNLCKYYDEAYQLSLTSSNSKKK